MKADDFYKKIEELKPKSIRPYKVVNEHIFVRCSKCYQWKLPSEFSSTKYGERFFQKRAECMLCQAERNRWYLKSKPEKQKEFIERRKQVLKLKEGNK